MDCVRGVSDLPPAGGTVGRLMGVSTLIVISFRPGIALPNWVHVDATLYPERVAQLEAQIQ